MAEPEIWIQCVQTEEDPFENSYATFDEYSLPSQRQKSAALRRQDSLDGPLLPPPLPPHMSGSKTPPHPYYNMRRNHSFDDNATFDTLEDAQRGNSLERTTPSSGVRHRRNQSFGQRDNSLGPSLKRDNSFGGNSIDGMPQDLNSLEGAPSPSRRASQEWSELNSQTRSKASALANISQQIAASTNSSASSGMSQSRNNSRPRSSSVGKRQLRSGRQEIEPLQVALGSRQKGRRASSKVDDGLCGMSNVEMALALIESKGRTIPRGKNSKSKPQSSTSNLMAPGLPPQRPAPMGTSIRSNADDAFSPPPSIRTSPPGPDYGDDAYLPPSRTSPPGPAVGRKGGSFHKSSSSFHGKRPASRKKGGSFHESSGSFSKRDPVRQPPPDNPFGGSFHESTSGQSINDNQPSRSPVATQIDHVNDSFHDDVNAPSNFHDNSPPQHLGFKNSFNDSISARSNDNKRGPQKHNFSSPEGNRVTSPQHFPPQAQHQQPPQNHYQQPLPTTMPPAQHQDYGFDNRQMEADSSAAPAFTDEVNNAGPIDETTGSGDNEDWRKYQIKGKSRDQRKSQQEQMQEQPPPEHQHQQSNGDQGWLKYKVGGGGNNKEDIGDSAEPMPRGGSTREGSGKKKKSKMSGKARRNKALSARENLRNVKQMPFTDQFGDSGMYAGNVNDEGRPDGKGSMKYENGVFYEGNWTDGCQDEKAAENYGRIRGGFTSWSGKGNQAAKSGMVLPWNARKNDAFDASKKTNVRGMEWTDLNGDFGRYTGEVNIDRLPHGPGMMKYDFGLIAEGEWVNGVLKENPHDRMISAAASMRSGGTGAMSVGPGGMSVGPGMSIGPGGMSVGGPGFASMGQQQMMGPGMMGGGMPMHGMAQPPMQFNPMMGGGAPNSAAQHAQIAQQNAIMRNSMMAYSAAGSTYGGASTLGGASIYGGGMPPQIPMHQMPMHQMPMQQMPMQQMQMQQIPMQQMPMHMNMMPPQPQQDPNKPPVSEIKIDI